MSFHRNAFHASCNEMSVYACELHAMMDDDTCRNPFQNTAYAYSNPLADEPFSNMTSTLDYLSPILHDPLDSNPRRVDASRFAISQSLNNLRPLFITSCILSILFASK